MSRIKVEEQRINLYNESDWDKMIMFLITNLTKFENAFLSSIKNLK
ncbi:DUF4268 domain-containing protein [Flavobacterium sp.]